LSVKIIAINFIVGGLLGIPGLFLRDPSSAVVLGLRVTGAAALVYNVGCLVVLALVLGVGLWRLSEPVRRLTVGFTVFWIVNGALALMSPASRAAMLDQVRQAGLSEAIGIGILSGMLVMSAVINGAIIWCLVTRKAAFVPRAPVGAATRGR